MIDNKKSNQLILLLSFIIALLIVINGIFSYSKMQQIKHEFDDVANRNLPLIAQLVPLIDRQFEQTLLIEKLHQLSQSHRLIVLDTLEGSFLRSGNKVESTLAELTLFIEPMLNHPRLVMRQQMTKVKATLEKITLEHSQYHYQVIDMIESIKSNQGDYHPGLIALLNNEEVELRRELIDLRDEIQRFTQQSAEEVEEHENQVIQNTLILNVSSFLLGALLLFLMVKIMKSRDAATHKINYFAHYDPLTSLVNRRYFFELFDQAFTQHGETQTALHLCVCDLDHFKGINDGLGHQAGDLALTQFAEILKQHISQEDIIGRFGGDEFIICFTEKTQEECEAALEKVRLALTNTNFTLEDGQQFRLTATFGLAHLAGGLVADSNSNKVFEAADKALYQAKQNGRNQIAFVSVL